MRKPALLAACLAALHTSAMASFMLVEQPDDQAVYATPETLIVEQQWFVGYEHELSMDVTVNPVGNRFVEMHIGLKYLDESATLDENLLAAEYLGPDIVLASLSLSELSTDEKTTLNVTLPITSRIDDGLYALAISFETSDIPMWANEIPTAYVIEDEIPSKARATYIHRNLITVITPDKTNLKIVESTLAGSHGNSLSKAELMSDKQSNHILRQNLLVSAEGMPAYGAITIRHYLEIPGRAKYPLTPVFNENVSYEGGYLNIQPACGESANNVECPSLVDGQTQGLTLYLEMGPELVSELLRLNTTTVLKMVTEIDPDGLIDEWLGNKADNTHTHSIIYFAE